MSILGNRIKFERERLNLTREELAKKLNVSYSAIAMYEQGNREPNNSLILEMCKIFDCSTDYLMGKNNFRKDINKYVELVQKNIATEIAYDNIKEFSKFDPSQQKIDDFIKLLIKFSLSCSEKGLQDITLEVHNFLDDHTLSKEFHNFYVKCVHEYIHLLLNYNLFIPNSNSKPSDNIHSNYPELNEQQLEKLRNIMNRVNKEFFNFNLVNDQQNYIKKRNDIQHVSEKITKVPIVGKIAAGQPILAEEYIEGYLPVDPNIYGVSTSEDLFYLRVAGQSMNLKVKNGDYALIKKQDYAEDGDIIVAIVNGDNEATLKRYKKLNDQFILLEPMSSDTSIEAITVDLKTTDFHIIGKAIGHFGKF